MALPGLLWLGWVRLGACQKHVHVHPSLKDAARHKPNARRNIHTRMGSAQSLQAAAFRPEHGLLSEAARGYLYRQDWENHGRIHASAKQQHLNPSNDGLEFF